MSVRRPSRSRGGRWWIGATSLAVVCGVAAPPAGAHPAITANALRIKLARDPAAGRVLGGITAQGWPVVMAISKNEKQVVGTIAGLVLSCSSGQQFPIEDAWTKLPFGPQGTVRKSAAIAPAQEGGGVAITGGSHSMQGKLVRRTGNFTGVWRVQLSFSSPSGPDQCDSGNVPFALKL